MNTTERTSVNQVWKRLGSSLAGDATISEKRRGHEVHQYMTSKPKTKKTFIRKTPYGTSTTATTNIRRMKCRHIYAKCEVLSAKAHRKGHSWLFPRASSSASVAKERSPPESSLTSLHWLASSLLFFWYVSPSVLFSLSNLTSLQTGTVFVAGSQSRNHSHSHTVTVTVTLRILVAGVVAFASLYSINSVASIEKRYPADERLREATPSTSESRSFSK